MSGPEDMGRYCASVDCGNIICSTHWIHAPEAFDKADHEDYSEDCPEYEPPHWSADA